MDENLIKELIEFGLGEYEAKVYLILTLKGPLTASEIAKLAKIPYSKVYEIVEKLKLKTIIESSSESGQRKFKALDTMHVMKRVIERKEDDIKRMKYKANEILKEIEKQNVPCESKEGIWISEGKREFLEKTSFMMKKASSYAYGITKEFSRISDLDIEIVDAVKRGVKVKILGIGKFNKLNSERAKWYRSRKVKIRTVDVGAQPRICLIDGKEVCLRIDNSNNSEFIWSNNQALLNFTKSYFDSLWKNARSLN